MMNYAKSSISCRAMRRSFVSNSTVNKLFIFFFSSRRRHTRFDCDWSSDVCSSDLAGLGAALATRFAAGYKVALIARSAELIGQVAGEIKSAGGVALPVQSDATIEAEIADAHSRIERELGPLDVLIYNGGRRPMGRLMDTTPQVFEETWRLHTLGAFLWARQVVPGMPARGSGTILITGATAGIRPW